MEMESAGRGEVSELAPYAGVEIRLWLETGR